LKSIYIISILIVAGVANVFGQQKENAPRYTQADSLRGTISSKRSCYDVLSYDLDIKVNIDEKEIVGHNTISFIAESDFSELQIDLFDNLKIEKIEYQNSAISYDRLYGAVFVRFPHVIKKGDTASIGVYYGGKPAVAKHAPWDGGFSWEKDSIGNPWVGVSCQHFGASSWWPCKDHQSDEPNQMFIRVSVPSYLMALSNGKLVNTTISPDGYTKYDWHVSYPINNYAVTLNIGKYKHFKESYVNKNDTTHLELSYYVLPYNFEKAKQHFNQVKPMLDCYYHFFGPYPFVKDGYKLVETPYLGMEHQSCIAYGNKYMNGYLGKDLSGAGYMFDYIIIHESAHEWWGNSITTKDIADMWIHEGFGTYAEALYVECNYGYTAYLKYINGLKKRVKNDAPIIGNYNVNQMGSYDMYPKGALLLHTLRSIIHDDTLFFKIIKEIQFRFKYQTIDSKDIEQVFSEMSSRDLSQVFDVYLREKNIPVFEYKLSKKGKALKLDYRYNCNKSYSMPILITESPNKYGFLIPTNTWQSITLQGISKKEFKVATELFYIDVNKIK
jgi:aminopeptidase N